MEALLKLYRRSVAGIIIPATPEVLKYFEVFKERFLCCSVEMAKNEILRVPAISSEILQVVLRWMKADISNPVRKKPRPNYTTRIDYTESDVMLCDLDDDCLIEVIKAANTLDVLDLMEVCSQIIADRLRSLEEYDAPVLEYDL